jgi:paired amphipathic helix protein Sin3a
LACSGRRELERSVLNDIWVSHPTWASEDSEFKAHRKNTFEEAMSRAEDERHEYAVLLQGFARTIAVLEPLQQRIDVLTPDERHVFKLKRDLGGPAPAIYERTVKRVYGREAGAEIYQALQDCPSVAVPVVLRRLRDKDAEWRRLQREWARAWRDADHKNFYRALDHQALRKASEKKHLTAKSFHTEIEAAHAEQVRLRVNAVAGAGARPACARGSPGPQLRYAFADTDVLKDVVHVVFVALDHGSEYVARFLARFLAALCDLPAAEFEAIVRPAHGRAGSDDSDDSRSGARSPSPDAQARAADEFWVVEDTASVPVGESIGSDPVVKCPLFVNSTLYTLVRLIQVWRWWRVTRPQLTHTLADHLLAARGL